ncbi:MAG: P-loop NTPase fold protein [Pseudomonadota bacterium]
MQSFADEKEHAIFLSYSHHDENILDELQPHLRVLESMGRILVWDDRKIDLAGEWHKEIHRAIERSSVAILLISANYLSSEWLNKEEVPALLQRREREGLMIMPILVAPCVWEIFPWLSAMQILPRGGISLTELPDEKRQKVYEEIVQQIYDYTSNKSLAVKYQESLAADEDNQPFSKGTDENLEDEKFPQKEIKDSQKKETNVYRLDNAADIDLLGRKCVSGALARLFREIDQNHNKSSGGSSSKGYGQNDLAFLANLHGRWGEGKSSVLNFLKANLKDAGNARPWVVIEINAWQHERLGVPWWSILTELSIQARDQCRITFGTSLLKLWWWEALWRLRSSWAPVLLLLALLSWLAYFGLDNAAIQNSAFKSFGIMSTEAENRTEVSNLFVNAEGFLSNLAAIFTILGILIPILNAFFLGSARTAKLLTELRGDPMKPMIRHFERLVNSVNQPVIFLIDDLDRCSQAYVVDALQTVQTLYRSAPVIYVVAADRQWICRSYQEKYEKFAEDYTQPGRSMGHLFLEKIFQLSVAMPSISPATQRSYWRQLTKSNTLANQSESAKAENHANVDAIFEGSTSEGDVLRRLKESENIQNSAEIREAAVRELYKFSEELEHFLLEYVKLVEANPRSMKRLLNLFRFNRDTKILSGTNYDTEQLALWCILQMRWPLLSEEIVKDPEIVKCIFEADPSFELIERISALADYDEVKTVFEGISKGLDFDGLVDCFQIMHKKEDAAAREQDVGREAAD